MNDTQIKTLEQVRQFLNEVEAIDLVIETKEARYAWIRENADPLPLPTARWDTCITCGAAPPTGSFDITSRRPAPPSRASASAVNPSPLESPDICAWIQSIRAI